MIRVLKKERKFYVAIGFIMFFSFSLNIFGLGVNKNWFNEFENYSDELVIQTVKCSAQGNYAGGLVNPPQLKDEGKQNECSVYPSQFGLQGFLYSAIPKITGSDQVLLIAARFIVTVLLVILLLMFIAFVHSQFDRAIAAIVSVFIIFSGWLAGFADKLYWVTFTMFLPFIFSLYAYPALRKRKKGMLIFWLSIFSLFLLRFLNGYEYISTIAISVATPIVYWEIVLGQKQYKEILKKVILTGLVSIAAFAVALGLHIGSLVNDYGSVSAAINAIEEKRELRADNNKDLYTTALYNFIYMQPETYELIDRHKDLDALYDSNGPPIIYISIMVLSYLLLPVINLPIEFSGLINVILESLIFWVVLAIILCRLFYIRNMVKQQEALALIWVLALSLLGVVSWFILAPGHVLVHAHINAIMYYLPLLLWVYLIIAIGFVKLLKLKKQ